MSIREKIEDHLGLVISGFVVGGFVAGFAAYGTIKSVAGQSGEHAGVADTSVINWEDNARQSGWVPKEECPAFPISLVISSPGDQSILSVSPASEGSELDADLVIRSSFPIAESMELGVVFNEEGSNNYYVSFPSLDDNENRKIFRTPSYDNFWVPFVTADQATLHLWALAVDDKASIGTVFGSLEQIKGSNETVVLSPKISVRLRVAQ